MMRKESAKLRIELAQKDREIANLETEALVAKRQCEKHKKDCEKLRTDLVRKQRESLSHAKDASVWKGHYRRLHASWVQQNGEMARFRNERAELTHELIESRFERTRTQLEKHEIEEKLKENLKRKHDNTDKELLEENKRLRLSLTNAVPSMECSICLETRELGQFIVFNPCGHLNCQKVS